MTSQRGGSTIASSKAGRAPVRLILASASPRRRELLAQVGLAPAEVRPADIVEVPNRGELPRVYAQRLATEKAAAVALSLGEVALAADTVVALGRRILEKPDDADEARRFLTLLSGRRHMVFTAVAVRDAARTRRRVVATAVRMKRLNAAEIGSYLDSREWEGKAGGYAIQGRAGAFIPWIGGSYSAVVGLPLTETLGLLAAAGVRP